MGGAQAANTLLDIKVRQLERSGTKLDETAKKELYESIKNAYTEQTEPTYGAARLWVDEIILPEETRERLVTAFEAVTQIPKIEPFNAGVLQT
jgi:acetyl-CoA carboxylase carboxyltransferase component